MYLLKGFVADEIVTITVSIDQYVSIIPSPRWWIVITNQCMSSGFKAAAFCMKSWILICITDFH